MVDLSSSLCKRLPEGKQPEAFLGYSLNFRPDFFWPIKYMVGTSNQYLANYGIFVQHILP